MDPKVILIGLVAVSIFSVVSLLLNRLAGKASAASEEVNLNSVFRSNKLIGMADSEEVFADINGRRRLAKSKKHVYPTILSRSEKELIIKVHESITLKDIRAASRSLGSDLCRLQVFKTPNVFISSGDRLDTFSIRSLSDDEALLIQLMRKSGLVKKDSSGEEVWPEIYINEKGVIQLKSYLLNLAEVEKAASDFNQLGRSYEMVEQDGSVFKISPIGAFDQFLKKGESVFDKSSEYLEKYVVPNKTLAPRWFLGINQFTGEEVWRDLIDTPAIVVAGGTGAGKTETVKSILFNLVATHPNTKIYTYDGSAKTTWLSIANNFSPYRLAVPVDGSVAKEAFFLVDQVFTEYKKRIELFKKENADNVIAYESKTGKKLERIVLLLEEYPVFANELNFEKTHLKEGSGAYKLKRLIQESRSYGFGYIFLTQTANGNTLPPIILNNLLPVVHRSSELVANHFELPVQTLPTGSYYVKTDQGKILCRNHYLGAGNDTFDKLLQIAQVQKVGEKKEIDPNFVQVTSAEKERSQFAPMLKSALVKQGFKVKEWDNSNHSSATGLAELKDMSVKIAFLKKDELSALHIKSVNDASCSHLLVLCEFAVDEKKELELVKRAQAFEFGENKVIFLTDSIWKRLIYQALESDVNDTFHTFLKSRTELLTLVERSENDTKSDSPAVEDDGEAVPDKNISLERLAAIKQMKARGSGEDAKKKKGKKGKALEAFIAGLFLKKGYEVIFGTELKRQKYTFHQPGTADGGLDLVARKGDELILIQSKNWVWDVDNGAVQQILAAAATLKGTRNEEATKLIAISASEFTQPARTQAEASGVELWNYARLIQETKMFEVEKRGKGRPKKAV